MDLKPHVKSVLKQEWQEAWNELTVIKLHSIKPIIRSWSSSFKHCRREEVVLARLRIGYARFSHEHLLKGENAPLCDTCNEQLTVAHVLISCHVFNHFRILNFGPQDLPLKKF